MTDAARLLVALQHGDSFFPSGAIAFSSGLENLADAGAVAGAADLADFVWGQVEHRWAPFDRPVAAAHRAAHDPDALAALDGAVEARSLAAAPREGSRRAGRALLSVHARMGVAAATDYQARVVRGVAHGHLPVVQGLVWAAVGLGEAEALALSAHACVTGLTGAALRLGLVGHVDAQAIRRDLAPAIERTLAADLPPVEGLHAFTPLAEIAVMRHETAETRLFMT